MIGGLVDDIYRYRLIAFRDMLTFVDIEDVSLDDQIGGLADLSDQFAGTDFILDDDSQVTVRARITVDALEADLLLRCFDDLVKQQFTIGELLNIILIGYIRMDIS